MAKQKTAAAMTADPGKERRVKKERARLMALFAGVDENKTDFIKNHVQQLAWLNVSILELQTQIDAAGAVIPYDNGGGQRGSQANPACKLLIEYEKLSNTIFRALLPVVPEKSAQDKLFDFLEDEEYQKAEEQRQREYEERRKKAEEDFKRAVEQQRREREQREKERAGQY